MLWYNRKVYIWSVKIPKKLVTCKKHKFLSGLENTFLLETVYIGNKYSNIVFNRYKIVYEISKCIRNWSRIFLETLLSKQSRFPMIMSVVWKSFGLVLRSTQVYYCFIWEVRLKSQLLRNIDSKFKKHRHLSFIV